MLRNLAVPVVSAGPCVISDMADLSLRPVPAIPSAETEICQVSDDA